MQAKIEPEISDAEIEAALEANLGYVYRAIKQLKDKNKDTGRIITASDINARIDRSPHLKQVLADLKAYIIDEAEWTIVARMLGKNEAMKRDMNAAFALLERYGNWKKNGDSNSPPIVLNFGPSFENAQEWLDVCKNRINDKNNKENKMN
jgi:cell fate (sporulation/competence/biofilm development) regulator YmcA (YheA/YmcA/DUF963 family)